MKERLIQLRKEKGWSQEELATQLHVTRQTISKWEQGHSVPDVDLLMQLCKIFEIPVQELLGETIEQNTNDAELVKQLAKLNEAFAFKQNRSKRIWHIVKQTLLILLILYVVFVIITIISSFLYGNVKTTHMIQEIVELEK